MPVKLVTTVSSCCEVDAFGGVDLRELLVPGLYNLTAVRAAVLPPRSKVVERHNKPEVEAACVSCANYFCFDLRIVSVDR